VFPKKNANHKLPETIFTFSSDFTILLISPAVLLGIIPLKLVILSAFSSVLYSLNLKLSVEANIASLFFIFTSIQAKVGLIFHSAAENKVLRVDSIKIFHFIFNDTSSFIVGIKGNSSLAIHLILILELSDFTSILSLFNSISISSSKTKFI
jgi:hypothetical protein